MRYLLALFALCLLWPVAAADAQTGYQKPPVSAKSWQWQIDGNALGFGPAQAGKTAIYDIDADWYSAADIAKLKSYGQYVICYTVVGVWETYRPDAALFPKSVIGGPTDDQWPGEHWLDIRPAAMDRATPAGNTARKLMEARFARAKAKGCQAIEGDYQNNIEDGSSFPVSRADQDAFNRWYVDAVHAAGMAAFLKNAPNDAARYAGWGYDGAVVEQCWQYNECGGYAAFVRSGKPVLNAEYKRSQTADAVCPKANALGLNTIHKPLSLPAKIDWACR